MKVKFSTNPYPLHFEVLQKVNNARTGILQTPFARVETPAFMPVGTRASVKGIGQNFLESYFDLILANTYHLWVRPGEQVIAKLGGLHTFMSWEKGILTDSGGFQVYSLAKLSKVVEDGVHFQSHLDGKKMFLTPTRCMEIQRDLCPDIAMCLDWCPALPATEKELEQAVATTLRWSARCREFTLAPTQSLFAIIQGGLNLELRQYCMDQLVTGDYAGYALGGLSVGEKNEEMQAFLKQFVPRMPAHAPRYLMGVGGVTELWEGVSSGLDLFDCVLPTRNGRNGQLFTPDGPINLKNQRFLLDQRPVVEGLDCPCCQRYTRAYLRHLLTTGEMLGAVLGATHNLCYLAREMRIMRMAIRDKQFEKVKAQAITRYKNNTGRFL